ncbi:hypothetical protein ACH5AU_30685 [Streptomyces albidoflavus]
MFPILCCSCHKYLYAEADGAFSCERGHARETESVDLGPDHMWLVDERGVLMRSLTPAAALRRMCQADTEYSEAPMAYDAELPPLLDLREAAFDFVALMSMGYPYPSEAAR